MGAVARLLPMPTLPLLAWPEAAEVARLEAVRRELHGRIERLQRHSHRRIVLEARLADVTARQLHIENAMRRRG